uniref:Uncharacterized protein n=1 Tax=Amphimedon queenslandica TaxID=400682 RepID=A0A1X7VVV8_AMPQE
MADADDGGFKYPLFGCFDDVSVCLYSYFCSCVAVGELAETLGDSKWMHCCLYWTLVQIFNLLGHAGYVVYIVGQVREQRGIEGSLGNDCLLGAFCSWCFLTQVIREVRDDPIEQNILRE